MIIVHPALEVLGCGCGQLAVKLSLPFSTPTLLCLLQMLCTFSALHHNSVLVVIVWTTAGGSAMEACVAYLLRCGHKCKKGPEVLSLPQKK